MSVLDNAPFCLNHCGRRVKPAYGHDVSKRFGPRIIHGRRWRWYCGRRCSGQATGLSNVGDVRTQKGVVKWRSSVRQQHIRRIIQTCGAAATSDGLVPIVAMVQTIRHLERLAFSRGWDARGSRQRTELRQQWVRGA